MSKEDYELILQNIIDKTIADDVKLWTKAPHSDYSYEITDVEVHYLDDQAGNKIKHVNFISDGPEDDGIDAFVLDNCIEWSNLISELSKKELELWKSKETYNQKEFEIVYQSDIDFKGLYDSTSEKVRKQHATNELKDLNNTIKSLELSIDYLKRRISFLRQLVPVKTALIGVKNDD